jgi:diguanylate cyclase (GGDEF)-like protein
VEASIRLASAIRSTDLVARLGGDEFAILLSGDLDQDGIEGICDRIVMSFSSAIDFKGAKIRAGVSVGVAAFPDHGETQEELYKSADLALYEAKHHGKNNWRWYSHESEHKSVHLHA